MAVAIVQQQQQKPNDKINIDLSNSNVAVVKIKKETTPSVKKEKKTPAKTESKVKEENIKKKNPDKAKEEVKNQKPVIKEVILPVGKDSKNSSKNLSNNSSDFASDVNRRLYEYESVKSNQANAMNEAIRLHNGDPSNTCVFFQGACLRAIGIPVPGHIGYTSNLWNWLENNNWEMHRDFSNIQKGDIIFAGEYHTMCFMGWKDKSKGIAYVMGNEAYTYGDSYAHRNLNGQAPTKENGWTRQYKATRYYKYKGNSSKNNSNIVKTNIVTSKPLSSKDHKYTVESLKGTVTAKQDVYVNEKPFPTTEGINPVGLANSGDKLHVTGRASNGWYEVLYNGQKAYISHKYTNFLKENKTTTHNKTVEVNKTNDKAKSSKSALQTVKTASIKANGGLWLHSSKDTSYSSRLTLMSNGAKVTILEESGSWYKVNYNGNIGWCASRYVTNLVTSQSNTVEASKIVKSNTSEASLREGHIKANGGLWLHSSKDSSTSSRLTVMGNGHKVEILEESGDWVKVRYNGNTGWCAKKFIA